MSFPHFRMFFFLLLMLLNYVPGQYSVVHSFFLKWKLFWDTNMKAGLYVHILHSRSTEFSWMLKSVMVQVMQQTGVVKISPMVQADD